MKRILTLSLILIFWICIAAQAFDENSKVSIGVKRGVKISTDKDPTPPKKNKL